MRDKPTLNQVVDLMVKLFRSNNDELFCDIAGAEIDRLLGPTTLASAPSGGRTYTIDPAVVKEFESRIDRIAFDEGPRRWYIPTDFKPEPLTPASVFLPMNPLGLH